MRIITDMKIELYRKSLPKHLVIIQLKNGGKEEYHFKNFKEMQKFINKQFNYFEEETK